VSLRKKITREVVPTFFVNDEEEIVEVAYTDWEFTHYRNGHIEGQIVGRTSVSNLPAAATRIIYETPFGCLGHADRVPKGWGFDWNPADGGGTELVIERCPSARGFAPLPSEVLEASE
jgi:hypothetical protein